MALVTPIVNNIPAFDATESMEITFTANGGDQIVKNEIQIINNATSAVVYTNTVTTFALGQTVPANTLVNGTYYKVAFRTYDAWNNTSAWSNYLPFYCYSTPTLTFNVSDGQTIYTKNLDLKLTYNQTENERLESAVIYYYDATENLISSSGNLFNSNYPPIIFTYPLKDFENNKIYKVKADATTINGTFITTGMVSFRTNYETIENESELYLTMDSCNGYINVRSSPVISALDGENDYNPDPLTYVEQNTMVDLTSVVGDVNPQNANSYWIKWYDISPVSNAFLFRLWFYPARTSFKVAELISDDESNRITITYNRGVSEDYICIRTTDGTSIDKGLGTMCNGNTKVFLWLKVMGSTWDVQTEILSETETIFEWNNPNDNINYNITSDVNYENEAHGSFVPRRDVYRTISGSFDKVIVGNGVFDTLDLSINVNKPYSSETPQHDISAVLFIHFNGSIDNDAPTGYTRAVLQRKDNTMLTWFNLAEIDISSDTPAEIDYSDYLIPNGVQQTYGLIVYKGDIPSDTYTVDIVPKWGRVFLSDKDETYKLNYAVIYSNGVQNIQNGVLMPISATFPTVIENSEGNYKSGSVQFKVLGYQFDIDKTLDRNSITKQTNDILAFLTNKKPKCIKDYNGNIFICKVINSPQISYDANWGNGITIISFDWVEQAKYNKYEEMVEMNIIDNNIPIPTPPAPPEPPIVIEPFVEKVYLPNGNLPTTIYPTQGTYNYTMYFGDTTTDINTAIFYMPSIDYNIVSYKMNGDLQTIPTKQYADDYYCYTLEFRATASGEDNGIVEIVVEDYNGVDKTYTFNFICTATPIPPSDFIRTSPFYINNTTSDIYFCPVDVTSDIFELRLTKKNNIEAYRAILYANGDTNIKELSFMFVSDNVDAVKALLTVYNTQTHETITFDYDNVVATCEYNNKTWYVIASNIVNGSGIQNTIFEPTDIFFEPDNPNVQGNSSYIYSYCAQNLLYHIYENPAPVGASITPTESIQTWLHCANIWGESTNDMNNIIANKTFIEVLINSHNAVDYLARCTSWAVYQGEGYILCNDSYAMDAIGDNNYCAWSLLDVTNWCEVICGSPYSTDVLNANIPTMTSNTQPSGECLCFPDNSSDAWKAFDSDYNTKVIIYDEHSVPDAYGENYIQYKFAQPIRINQCFMRLNEYYYRVASITLKIQASNDGTNWTDLYTLTNYYPTQGNTFNILNNRTKYLYYRIWFNKALYSDNRNYYYTNIGELNFFGRT